MGDKKLSTGLFLGVVLLPIVFVWFINDEYPKKTKRNAYIWLAINILGAIARANKGS